MPRRRWMPSMCTVLAAAAGVWWGAGVASAQPAPWFWWASKHDSTQRVCAQHMPVQGWARGAGPFANAQCQAAQRTLIYQRPPQLQLKVQSQSPK